MSEYIQKRSHLLQSRPTEVEAAADQQFCDAARESSYTSVGRDSTYRWPTGHGAVVDPQDLPDKSRILDVGAARGTFIQTCAALGHTAFGLTAKDYAEGSNKNIVMGDAHRLMSVLAGQDLPLAYDLVVSRYTLMHLKDPLTCLEQMLNLTARGGRIVTDSFEIPTPATARYELGAVVLGALLVTDFWPSTQRSQAAINSFMEACKRPMLSHTQTIPGLDLTRGADGVTRLPVTHVAAKTGWHYKRAVKRHTT